MLKTMFFLLSVVFIHPAVSYSDWCVVHSYSDTKELSNHSAHISEHLRFQQGHDGNGVHIEEAVDNCVDASAAFIQASSLKSPELKVAVAYILREIQFPTSDLVADSLVNDVKNATSLHLTILRSVVVII